MAAGRVGVQSARQAQGNGEGEGAAVILSLRSALAEMLGMPQAARQDLPCILKCCLHSRRASEGLLKVRRPSLGLLTKAKVGRHTPSQAGFLLAYLASARPARRGRLGCPPPCCAPLPPWPCAAPPLHVSNDTEGFLALQLAAWLGAGRRVPGSALAEHRRGQATAAGIRTVAGAAGCVYDSITSLMHRWGLLHCGMAC